jgi:hypothetical protein
MVPERDNPAERLARIDKLMAENKPTPAAQQIARLQASLMVVSLPQGPSLAVGRTPRRIASALTPNMTDAEQLVTLRAWLGWPWKTLDPLAVEVATMGRLRDAVDEADRLRGERTVSRSNSSSTFPVAQVPVPISAISRIDPTCSTSASGSSCTACSGGASRSARGRVGTEG